ncbi:MAG: alkyl sulfatase dimerization domain-containing protein [Candidatus Hodarchaeota archaeon]
MGIILDLAEDLWSGRKDTYTEHPWAIPHGIEKIKEKTWVYKAFANTIIRETDDGLVIVDPAGVMDAKSKYKGIRSVTSQRLNTAIFTHGHVDHIASVERYIKEAKKRDWTPPKVIAHELVPKRFDRYRESAPWNDYINGRQFLGGKENPTFRLLKDKYVYPDITFSDKKSINVGGVNVYMHHTRGETDDAIWVYFPDDTILCTGDLFIWGVPNAGNPQKVHRYAKEWAIGLREMAALDPKPKILIPGHGVPIIGEDRVRQALDDTASLLEILHDRTVELMNDGKNLNTVLHSIKVPEDLLDKPYLHPIYDEPEFILRNIWRLYGGWWDGQFAELKPAPLKEQADEYTKLAGGARNLAKRAGELLSNKNYRLACHLAEWAYISSPDDEEVRDIASRVFLERAKIEPSTMAMGIYITAARTMGANIEEEMPGNSVVLVQKNRGKKLKLQ